MKRMKHITPTAKRNSVRVAVGAYHLPMCMVKHINTKSKLCSSPCSPYNPALRINRTAARAASVCSMVVVMLMVAGLTNKKRRGDVFYPFFVLFIINNV